jgi:hypothetical protein
MDALTPSTRQFRVVVVAALVAWTIAMTIPHLGVVSFSDDVANARTWNYLEALLPFRAVQTWWVLNAIATLMGLMGLLRFWPPARWILAGVFIATLLVQPLIGLAVFSPFEATFGGLYGAAFVWLITVSFWSGLAKNFARVPQQNDT